MTHGVVSAGEKPASGAGQPAARASARRWLLRGLAFAFSLVLGVMIAQQLWPLWNTAKPEKRATTPPPVAQVIEAPTRAVTATPPQPLGNDSSVAPVAQPLVLVATEPGRTPTDGVAKLGVNRDSPQTYLAGAILANGAQLVEVHVDHVVLQLRGRTERLYLNESGKPRANSLAMVGGAAPEIAAPQPATDKLSAYLRLSAIYESSGMVGYEVMPGQQAGLFTQLGLQSGDVITSVDGMPLVEAATAWQALSRLADGDALAVTVRRAQSTQKILLDGALVTSARQARAAPLPPPQF